MVVKQQLPHTPGSYHSVSRSEEIIGDIWVGLVVTAMGALFSVVACGAIAFGVASAIQSLGEASGWLESWAALVRITAVEEMTAETFGALIINNLLFGAAVGTLFGLMQFVLRWRKGRHREAIEAVVSPTGVAALSYGATCLAFHVLISCLAAWAAGALFGVFVPSPADLLAGQHAGLFVDHLIGPGGGGGAGDEGIGLIALFIFILLIAALVVCNGFAVLGWVFFRLASWGSLGSAAGEGAVSGVVSGIGARGAGVLVRAMITRYGVKKNGWSYGGDHKRAESDLREDGTSFFHAFITAAITGSLHAVVYATIVLTISALFGISVMGGEPAP